MRSDSISCPYLSMLTLCCRLSLKSLYLASEVLQKARTCWSATAQVLGRITYHLRSEWVLCLVPWSDSFVAAFNFNRISITTKIITDRYSVPFACLCWFFHISSLSGAIDQSNSCFSSTLAGQLDLNCHHWIVDPPNHRHRDYPWQPDEQLWPPFVQLAHIEWLCACFGTRLYPTLKYLLQ